MKNKNENKIMNFHAKLSTDRNRRFVAAVKKSKKDLRIKNKTDLFEYMLDTFCDAIGVK